uniref:Uncharacterized protein n=1 Tax=Schistocephalus solidus TaxID=70667 RepID=A0A0V0J7G3_SCHSO
MSIGGDETRAGTWPFLLCSIGLVSVFSRDSTHLVYLGVVQVFLRLWVDSPREMNCRLSPLESRNVSNNLLLKNSYPPREFAQQSKDLEACDKWNESEWKLFLLYTGFMALNCMIVKLVEKVCSCSFPLGCCYASVNIRRSCRIVVICSSTSTTLLCLYGVCHMAYYGHTRRPCQTQANGPLIISI